MVGAGATVGPFSYLRPGTELGAGGKIGGFVETKNAQIGDGAKVPHLSYVGDAEIGEGTNIGAGTIFANYDGVAKHRTRVGRHARTASNNTFVAPVDIGDGAATGAGTVVRRDVPPGRPGGFRRTAARHPEVDAAQAGRHADGRSRRGRRSGEDATSGPDDAGFASDGDSGAQSGSRPVNPRRLSGDVTPRRPPRERTQAHHREEPHGLQWPGAPRAR